MTVDDKPELAHNDELKEFVTKVRRFGVETDIAKRWEEGTPHHPKSIETFKGIEMVDWLWGDDFFCWKSGGDGDNGEALMYLMDIYFDFQEAEKSTKK